jgi:hypothetical protein
MEIAAIKFKDEAEAIKALPVLRELDHNARVVGYCVQVEKPKYSPVGDSYGVHLTKNNIPYRGYITL